MSQGLLDLTGEFHTGACETEVEAARLVTPKVPDQALKVLAEIVASKGTGLTGWQLCDRLHMLRGSVSRSLTQLSKPKDFPPFITVAGKRREATGARARVWIATDEGRNYLRQPSQASPVDGPPAPQGVKAQLTNPRQGGPAALPSGGAE